MMDNSGKFGDFSVGRFGFIVRTDRQIDRQTHRQTNKHRQTESHTDAADRLTHATTVLAASCWTCQITTDVHAKKFKQCTTLSMTLHTSSMAIYINTLGCSHRKRLLMSHGT